MQIEYCRCGCRNKEQDSNQAEKSRIHKAPSGSRFYKELLTQRRKGAKKALEARQRFAALRRCVRSLLRQ
jgi:hypothetical protein